MYYDSSRSQAHIYPKRHSYLEACLYTLYSTMVLVFVARTTVSQ